MLGPFGERRPQPLHQTALLVDRHRQRQLGGAAARRAPTRAPVATGSAWPPAADDVGPEQDHTAHLGPCNPPQQLRRGHRALEPHAQQLPAGAPDLLGGHRSMISATAPVRPTARPRRTGFPRGGWAVITGPASTAGLPKSGSFPLQTYQPGTSRRPRLKPSPPRFRSFATFIASPCTLAASVAALALVGFGGSAHAQFGGQPGGMQPGGMGPQMGEDPKEEGPAEEAPEEEQQPQRPRAAGRLRRPGPPQHPGRPARRLLAPAHGLLPQAAPGPDLHHRGTPGSTGPGGRRQLPRTPPFPVPLECPVERPAAAPRTWAAATCACGSSPPSTSPTRCG